MKKLSLLVVFVGIFITHFSAQAREVTLSWSAINKATQYTIQIALDEKFEKIYKIDSTLYPTYKAEIVPGKYFYRVQAIDDKKQPGLWSASMPLVINLLAPELVSPLDHSSQDTYEKNASVELSWKPVEGQAPFVPADANGAASNVAAAPAVSPTPTPVEASPYPEANSDGTLAVITDNTDKSKVAAPSSDESKDDDLDDDKTEPLYTIQYHVDIFNENGDKVSEKTVDAPKIKINDLGPGDYKWKVKALQKGDLVLESDESTEWHFRINKKSLIPPILIAPETNILLPIGTTIEFKWRHEKPIQYSTLTVERVSGGSAWSKSYEVKDKDSVRVESLSAGQYRWFVNGKESVHGEGINSESRTFEIRKDVISGGDYELEVSASLATDTFTTDSSRQTPGFPVTQFTKNMAPIYGITGGYYLFAPLGFFVSLRSTSMTVENTTQTEQEMEASMRLRFGSRGFVQEMWLGGRIMDLPESENTPTQVVTPITTTGPVIGTRLSPTLSDDFKLQFSAFYYKPLTTQQNLPDFNGDVYGLSLGLKWNFFGNLWLGYRISDERAVMNIGTPLQPPRSTHSGPWIVSSRFIYL